MKKKELHKKLSEPSLVCLAVTLVILLNLIGTNEESEGMLNELDSSKTIRTGLSGKSKA